MATPQKPRPIETRYHRCCLCGRDEREDRLTRYAPIDCLSRHGAAPGGSRPVWVCPVCDNGEPPALAAPADDRFGAGASACDIARWEEDRREVRGSLIAVVVGMAAAFLVLLVVAGYFTAPYFHVPGGRP